MPRIRVFQAGRTLRGFAVFAITLFCGAAAPPPAYEGERFGKLITVDVPDGVVASENAQASAVGIAILDAGGNAMDAAIATAFAIGVTYPHVCGLGAAGHMVYRSADGSTLAAVNFREKAPMAMTANTFNAPSDTGAANQVKPGLHGDATMNSGHTIVGVPGFVAGMHEALELGSGKFTLSQLIEPAERLASRGIRMTSGLYANLLLGQAKFAQFPESARLYGGRVFNGPGDTTFLQPELARSLRLIIANGPKAFYGMEPVADPDLPAALGSPAAPVTVPSIGALIVQDMTAAVSPADVGLIRAQDLTGYEALRLRPLVGHYRDHEVITMPPTSSGMTVLEVLNLLENFRLASYGFLSADHLHLLAEAQKLAWADRLAFLADPAAMEPSRVEQLTSKRYAQRRGAEIELGTARSIEDYAKGPIGATGNGAHTTHLSVIDAAGNAVAMTCSLGSPFGSGLIARGTGFFLNNEMDDFDWCWQDAGVRAPDDESRCRAQGVPVNAPGPGKRPRSAQSPTIVVKDSRAVLATGGAGGPTIVMGVIQQVVNVVDFGMDIFHAMDAPRADAAAAHMLWFAMDPAPPRIPLVQEPYTDSANCNTRLLHNSYLAVEHNRVPDWEAVASDLGNHEGGRGHHLCLVDYTDGYTGLPIVQSAGTDPVTGNHLAVSDPRAFFINVFGTDLDYYDNQGAAGQPGTPPPLVEICTAESEAAGLCCSVESAEAGHCESR